MSKKIPKTVISASLFEYSKGSTKKSPLRKASRESPSTSTQSSPTPYPHPSTEIGHAQNISLSQMFNQRASVSRSSALKLTCRKASRCLFLGFLLATSSLSWVLPATQGGLSFSLSLSFESCKRFTDQTVALEVILSSLRFIPG